MTRSPFINAGAAFVYIALIVNGIFYFAQAGGPEDTIIIPITMLSLLVLSVATMGYLFFYQPVLLLLAGKHKEGVTLFLHTLGIFACIIVVLLAILFSLAVL